VRRVAIATMNADKNLLSSSAVNPGEPFRQTLRNSYVFVSALVVTSLLAALLLPNGLTLAAIGDLLQVSLVAAATVFSFQNATRSRSRLRAFWLLICFGCGTWLTSLSIWSVYELYLHKPAPDLPFADLLLFLKIVPLTAAIFLEPQKPCVSKFRAFGLLDVSILVVYSLYLFSFCALVYRLLPGAVDVYNFQFNVADAIGNQILLIAVGSAIFRSDGEWKALYRIYFAFSAAYCLASSLSNAAIDLGKYYTGSLYDVPFTAAVAALVCFTRVGGLLSSPKESDTSAALSNEEAARSSFVSTYLAMFVTLSAPAIGIWLLTTHASLPQLFPVRLGITLLTIFILTLLLSIKLDLLTTSLLGTLQGLSATYTRIERFENHLIQTEKLTSLGEAVARSANQIKEAMISIRELAHALSRRASTDPKVPSMSGKIAHYALRTDNLVQNMLRFAQETPIQLSPTDLKPLLESAIQLSRIAKLPSLRVNLRAQEDCPSVQGDSSQLLHVFLQLLSNAADALEESGGTLDISLASVGSQLLIQFADSGPGIKDPEHVFEPFYTTKPVGKGTGLGLSTCYGIVQQHEGEIFCRNRPEGGALFVITLPAIAADHVSLATPEPQVVSESS
jgi:signal transduction histidine kinase